MNYETRLSVWMITFWCALWALAGCSDSSSPRPVAVRSQAQVVEDGGAENDAGDEDAAIADEDAGTVALSDAQILTVVTAVNDAEIAAGNFALLRADAPEVRDYARQMVADHTAANQAVASLRATEGLSASGSALVTQVGEEAAAALAALESTPSPAFNRAYIAAQERGHTQILELIDAQLLSDARPSAVRDFLVSARATVVAHRDAARAILATPEAPIE